VHLDHQKTEEQSQYGIKNGLLFLTLHVVKDRVDEGFLFFFLGFNGLWALVLVPEVFTADEDADQVSLDPGEWFEIINVPVVILLAQV
jgi:hypothetical protein